MNVIEFESEKYKRFVYDDNFRRAMGRRFRSYLLEYRHNGEVAFDNFIVIDDKNVKGIFWKTFEPATNLYGIGARFPIRKRPRNITSDMPYLNGMVWPSFLVTVDAFGDGLDVACDIFEEDPIWNSFGIHTVQDLFRVFPDAKKSSMDASILVALVFAKVQSEALKARKEIIRVTRSETETSESEGTSKRRQSGKRKKIYLCSGIRYMTTAAASEETRAFIRRCESWHVRGHYRHLKNGKVVYVRPHMKGTGKAKTSTYKLES